MVLDTMTSLIQSAIESGIAVDYGERAAQRMFGDMPQPYRLHGGAKRRYGQARRNFRGLG